MTSALRRVLVLNAGSSSLKYRLFGVDGGGGGTVGKALAIGSASSIGDVAGALTHDGATVRPPGGVPSHDAALSAILHHLGPALGAATGPAGRGRGDGGGGAVRAGAVHPLSGGGGAGGGVGGGGGGAPPPRDAPTLAVGHRVVHGGATQTGSALVTPAVEAAIRAATPLAPLHNPANLAGIAAATAATGPGVPHVAVFDTAFHATLPPAAYTYALPAGLAAAHGLRRYGFHGTSYSWAARHVAAALGVGRGELNAVVLHLGAGASAAVLRNGVSVDTSMGLTPLEGLVMATRAGDVDAGAVLHLLRHAGLDADGVDEVLNHQSGLLGLAGSPDMRTVLAAADGGDAAAAAAVDVFVHRVRRYLGAYLLELGGEPHALVFTAGIGEAAPRIRAAVVAGLERWGIVLDGARNEAAVADAPADRVVIRVSADTSRIPVLVVRADEEREIANHVVEVLREGDPARAAAGG